MVDESETDGDIQTTEENEITTDPYTTLTSSTDSPTLTSSTGSSTLTSSTGSSTLTSSTESTTAFTNASLTTQPVKPDDGMNAGGSVGVAIVVILLVVGGVLIIFYLRKTGRLKCLAKRRRTRRSSTSSSRRALQPEDTESVDNMPRITDSDMFAITEPEENEPEHEVAGDDGYYYDEVFGSSAFEDETTKASNKELYSVGSDQEVPDLLLRVDAFDFK